MILKSAGWVAVDLVATDFNRQRWMLAALRSHQTLRASLARCAGSGSVTLIDSTALQRSVTTPPPGTHVVLWDGLISLLELEERAPPWLQLGGLRTVCVGLIPDIRSGLPADVMALFDQVSTCPQTLRDGSQVGAPLAHRARAAARVRLRPLRNWSISSDRHRALKSGGRLVFCGLVQPPVAILRSFLRGSGLARDAVALESLSRLDWHGRPGDVRPALASVLELLQHRLLAPRTAPRGVDWACAYTLMNVLHRMAVLSLLSVKSAALFVNEFGKQPNLDPYDAVGYGKNLYLDFGSTRGPDAVYPRRVDLMLNDKAVIGLRLLQPTQALAGALASWSVDSLWAECEVQAQGALSELARLSEAGWS